MTLRLASVADAGAIAAIHAERIAEGFLVTLGPAFLGRLYRRIASSSSAFVLVVDRPQSGAPNRAERVSGFIAVAESTAALYREFLLRDGIVAGFAATRGIVRAPRAVSETLRYGLRGGRERGHTRGAEVLATAVSADLGKQGIGTRLVRAAVEELARRGAGSARVVTATGNLAAVRVYEQGGFRLSGVDEVHRGVTQQLLVWP